MNNNDLFSAKCIPTIYILMWVISIIMNKSLCKKLDSAQINFLTIVQLFYIMIFTNQFLKQFL